jgi:hypothetical protein
VRLRTAQVGTTEITTVDGLPVTTAMRTITDLLHTGADGGHIGGVIADAERRDLIAVDDLAERVQPFARKYGLKVSATGYDLINHLVAQAGESLRRQEVDRASQEGFDQAVHLLAERPDLIELAWVTRAAARQQNPEVSEVIRKMWQPNPALMESIRKLTQPDPEVSEVIRKMWRPNPATTEAMQKLLQPNPRIKRAVRNAVLSPGTLKALGEATLSAPPSERTGPSPRPSDGEGGALSSGGAQELDGTSSQGPKGA